MKRLVLTLALTLAVGIGLGMTADHLLMAQQAPAPAPVKRTPLQQKDIEGMPGREAVMYMADIIPGGVAGRHSHPGPELGYVLSGSFILEPDGQPPVTYKAGQSFYNPGKKVHNAKNASPTAPAKILVFLISEKGQPLSTAAK